jgi:UDPglucose--hexose-1-phosphate uridylyltransferase
MKPELRTCPVRGLTVCIDPRRRLAGRWTAPAPEGGPCPLCVPPQAALYRDGDLFVVPNPVPLFGLDEGDLFGANEVVVEAHDADWRDPARVLAVLRAWAARVEDLRRDPRLRVFCLFKERGGARLAHGHAQLLARSEADAALAAERAIRARAGRCPVCAEVERAEADGVRIAWERDGWMAMSPTAPVAPFETWVLSEVHRPFGPDPDLAGLIADSVRGIDAALATPPLLLVLWLADPEHHWRVEVRPRLGALGAADALGMPLHGVPPERAAAWLRFGG